MPNLGFYAVRPIWAVRRLFDKLHELRHPGEPWMSPGAVRFVESRLAPGWRALELGSGRSTAWFARRVSALTSIEDSPVWFERVKADLAGAGLGNVELRLLPLEHPIELTTERASAYPTLPRYVAAIAAMPDGALDLVVVDGHYRRASVDLALAKLREGGLLLVDDTDRWPDREWGVPPDWPMLHRSTSIMKKTTTVWQKPAPATGSSC
jgi:SAM-dependent methyltransferase